MDLKAVVRISAQWFISSVIMSLQNKETERVGVSCKMTELISWSNTEYMMLPVICIQIKRETPALSKHIKQIAIFDKCICLFILIYLNKSTPRGLLSFKNPKMLSDVSEQRYICRVKQMHNLKLNSCNKAFVAHSAVELHLAQLSVISHLFRAHYDFHSFWQGNHLQ